MTMLAELSVRRKQLPVTCWSIVFTIVTVGEGTMSNQYVFSLKTPLDGEDLRNKLTSRGRHFRGRIRNTCKDCWSTASDDRCGLQHGDWNYYFSRGIRNESVTNDSPLSETDAGTNAIEDQTSYTCIYMYIEGDILPLRVGIFVSEVGVVWCCVDFVLAVDELGGWSWKKTHH